MLDREKSVADKHVSDSCVKQITAHLFQSQCFLYSAGVCAFLLTGNAPCQYCLDSCRLSEDDNGIYTLNLLNKQMN